MNRLLIIEDDEGLADDLLAATRRLGWNPVLARDGAAGLVALADAAFDVVLCDLQIPHGNGLSVIAAAAKHPGHPRIVAMTGMVDTGFYLMVASRAGAHAVLAKPFTSAQLKAILPSS